MQTDSRVAESRFFSRDLVDLRINNDASRQSMIDQSWEPSESDRTFLVSGSLSVAKPSGHSELSYSQAVSVAAANPKAASKKVRAMLLLRAGLTDADVLEDGLEVVPKPCD